MTTKILNSHNIVMLTIIFKSIGLNLILYVEMFNGYRFRTVYDARIFVNPFIVTK